MNKTKSLIRSLYNKNGSFSFSPLNKISNLYSTCFGVLALDLINELKNYSLYEKEKMISYLSQFQDSKSGLFIDENCEPNKKSVHDLGYIQLQITDFSQMALMILGAKPKYNYNFLTQYKDKKYLEKWLYNLNWKNPWLVSNKIMFILNSLIYEQEFFNTDNKRYIDFIISWLNKTQDKKNGYWNFGKKSTSHNQMAGAYHFLFFYTYLNKKPNYVKEIINSTLAIQDYDGLFNYAGGGGSCDDLDAIDLLCRATFYTDYRKKDIEKALKKAYNSLLKNQNIDGGFCWAKRNSFLTKKILLSLNFKLFFRCGFKDFKANFISKIKNQITILFFTNKLIWKYSNLENMKIKLNESDIWSTWFRLLAIAIIEETFPKLCGAKKSFKWKMKSKCGLGFYKNETKK